MPRKEEVNLGEGKMVKIINMTPHDIVMMGADNQILLTVPSSGEIRCRETAEFAGAINLGDGVGFQFFRKTFGKPYVVSNGEETDIKTFLEGFPRETVFIVSRAALESIEIHRSWAKTFFTFCCPSDLVRDGEGKIIGCKSFSVI